MSNESYLREFAYLDQLRDSAEINMFQAAPRLQTRFGHDRAKAKAILLAWMQHCEESSP